VRKVTYGAAVSLDGFITDADEALDWLRWTDDVRKITADSWKGVDAMLMGRKTWEFAVRQGGGGGRGGPSGMTTYIFSTTMTEAPEGAELVREDAVGFVRALKEAPGGDIILMGGGELAAALIAGGTVDEIGLNVHPLLLGGGVPMFPAVGGRTPLKLIEARSIASDCVLLRYEVAASA